MTMQEMDRMNDSQLDAFEAAYHRQQERDYDAMVNEEPPYDEELEMKARIEANPAHYQSNPYQFKLPTSEEMLEEFMYNKATHD